MAESPLTNPRFKTRNLLGVLPFLWRYPRALTITVTMLLMIISIELTLPRVIGHDLLRRVRKQIEARRIYYDVRPRTPTADPGGRPLPPVNDPGRGEYGP